MKMQHRRSIRLQKYDYSYPGEYFVTICTKNRECLFGDIVKGKMVLNEWGNWVRKFCLITENHFHNIKFDSFVIMPNHFHVIIKIIDNVGAGSPRPHENNENNENNENKGRGNPGPTLGQIVGFFKYGVSKQINLIRNTPGVKLWQRNYYEHIIRDNNEHNRISEYIRNNSLKWESDSMQPYNH